VFVQVCVVSDSSHRAEIVYYRPNNLGVWTAIPAGKTVTGQDVYNGFWEGPTPLNTAFAVHVLGGGSFEESHYFIYLMRQSVTPEWSEWMRPDGVETAFPQRIEKSSKLPPVDESVLITAPRLRFRTELLGDYDRTRLSGERYKKVPSCL
jgi:hypothetical protein